jgi:hypothetical protein
MKEHFCSVEKSMITYQGKCNWCGEQEALAQMQEPDVQETLHWHAFNYRKHTPPKRMKCGNSWSSLYSKIKAPQRTWVGLTDIDYAGLPLEQVGMGRSQTQGT